MRAQHPAADDVLRLGRGGLVEDGGGRGAPVDEQRLALVVAQPDPADVARLGVALGPQVEPAEDQALVGGVELSEPARGLVDHRVALDEPALVAEPAAVVPLAGELLGGEAGPLELAVHAVDERLLVRDLALHELLGHACGPHLPAPPRRVRGVDYFTNRLTVWRTFAR